MRKFFIFAFLFVACSMLASCGPKQRIYDVNDDITVAGILPDAG